MRKIAFAVAAGVAVMAALIACQKGPEVDESKVIARVGEAVLTAEDLARLNEDQHKVRMPVYFTLEELMEEWVRSEVLLQHALEEGIDEEKECAWRLYNSKKGIVIQRMWEVKIYEKYPELSEEEALKWYEENKDEVYKAKNTGVWLRRILLNSKESADDVMRRLRAGENFETIARKESVTPERLEGGSQGYRRLQDISPAYRDAVSKLKEGEFAGPFKLATFYAILKLEDRVEPGEYLKPEGIGMKQLRDKAKVETWREKAARLGADLEAAADIERHPERIPEDAVEMALGEEPRKTKPGAKK